MRSGMMIRAALLAAALAVTPIMALRNGHAAEGMTPAAAGRAAKTEAQTIQLFGASIKYYEVGRGPTLVLVHGLGSSAQGDWGKVMADLAKTHHVLALDQLGFGASDKPMIDYAIQTWVDFLGEFLRQKKVTDFTLMGESLGGWISAQYTIQALDGVAADPAFALPKPSRLVLCDAAGRHDTMAKTFGPKPTGTDAPPPAASLAGQKALLGAIFHDPRWSNGPAALKRGFAWSLSKGDAWTIHSVYSNPALLNEAVDGKLKDITIPTLVVWGAEDKLLPPADGQFYADGIPGAKLVTIPDSGHAPMIETPKAFLAAIALFL
ncbi:pimeloyl-ACP methyl ester carboxylesterase [Nitrospirillum amazonense]|uniref:Pimeloyl-ACP methyl ester carboxylesterase n=2 Tax=Nitrospirillum amazonense TaxID=28077 RepID=A0A560FK49_9PROT|nr:pimeloyl-ACP methyl ester carboxylesterase [Nitrospirillum amazonense]